MDTSLLDILRRTCYSNSTDKPTHETMYGPCQKWTIKDTEWETFWYEYCKCVDDSEKIKSKNLFLAELPKRYMPLMVECTLKFHPLEGRDETFGIDFIYHTIFCYQQILLDALNISEEQPELICCILETDDVVEDNMLVSRFKLHFPFCKVQPSVQNNIIRPKVLKLLRTENVLGRLFCSAINEWEDIIDPSTPLRSTPMYGSTSKPDMPIMRFDRIVGKLDFDDISQDKVPDVSLEDVFRPELHENVNQQLVKVEMFDAGDIEFWLPMFLSLNYYLPTVTAKSYETNDNSHSLKTKSVSSRTNEDRSNDEQTPEDMAERFITLLSPMRAQREIFWLDIGKALYTTFRGGVRGLELWTAFTEKSDEYTEDDCHDYYHGFFGNKITVKTLAWFAREDSPAEYSRWHKEWYSQAIENATSALHNDVAEAIYRVYWLEFACSKLEKGNIYHFDTHIWKKLDNGQSLRVMMTKDFVKILEGLRLKIGVDIYDSNDNKHKDSAESVIKKIGSLISKLKTRTYKNNVLGELLEKFWIDDFEAKLDSNDSLLGCFNGVIEASDTEAVLRPGKPEDYVSKTTGLAYRDDYTWESPMVKEVVEWMNQVFPDKELYRYAGKLFGSCIRGRNSEKIFGVLTGQGDNSKSMLKKALECALGPYCITFPTAIFTTKRQGTGPIPELARSKAVRVAMVQEPDSDDALRNGAIKEFTGGDRFFARMCNENGGEIDAMFKLFLMCNHIPIIPHCDQAIKNRVRIIPFLSTWKHGASHCKETQYKERIFPIDPRFERKIPRMASAFLFWMVSMYGLYCKESIVTPKIVLDVNNTYWEESDIYLCFIAEALEYVRHPMPNWPEGKEYPIDTSVKISCNDIYSRFKDWMLENHSGIKVPDKSIAKSEFGKRLKQKCINNNFEGLQFKGMGPVKI